MNRVQIFFIYAPNCDHCEAASRAIENAVLKCKEISCEVRKIVYNDKVAINIAINKDIDDLPGIVISDSVFKGKDYSEAKIIEAIRKSAKNEKL